MAEEIKKFPDLVLSYGGKRDTSWKEYSRGCYLSKHWQHITA